MSNLTRYYNYIAYAIVSRARLALRENLVREAQDTTLKLQALSTTGRARFHVYAVPRPSQTWSPKSGY